MIGKVLESSKRELIAMTVVPLKSPITVHRAATSGKGAFYLLLGF
jgi:hypothetical protein